MVTDGGQIVVREQWDHPYKEGSSLFRFHISVANIVQSVHDADSELNTIINVMKLEKVGHMSWELFVESALLYLCSETVSGSRHLQCNCF